MQSDSASSVLDMKDLDPFGNFHDASNSALEYLHELVGFDLWMVTRTEGDDWIVLQSADRGYGVQQGDVFKWTDSFCSRMVQGLGPCIAPNSNEIPAYAEAPIGEQVPIGAYVGVPLRLDDRLFGTLCAIHPTPRPESVSAKLRLVELLARLLSSILQAEIKASEENRRAERASLDAMTDAITGLYNRRGWGRLTAAEQSRCHRYGHPAGMISIDLDGLKTVNDTRGHAKGDELIQRAAAAIQAEMRSQDLAARLGGDEFGVLAVECDPQGSEALLRRLQDSLQDSGVAASLGLAICQPGEAFNDAWDRADQAMYEIKRTRSERARELVASAHQTIESAVACTSDALITSGQISG